MGSFVRYAFHVHIILMYFVLLTPKPFYLFKGLRSVSFLMLDSDFLLENIPNCYLWIFFFWRFHFLYLSLYLLIIIRTNKYTRF